MLSGVLSADDWDGLVGVNGGCEHVEAESAAVHSVSLLGVARPLDGERLEVQPQVAHV